MQGKGTSVLSALDKWHSKADGNCAIDYAFHMIISDVNDTSLKEMEACIDAGVNTFKMFMAYPGVFYATDGEILRAMQKARDTGSMIMMHAENGIAIDQLILQALANGQTEPVQHGLTRPPELEGEATSRRSRWPRSPARRCTSCTCPPRTPSTPSPRPRHRPERVRRDLPAVPLPVLG